MPLSAREYNFDGLVGPTHNFAGLSLGNVASEAHKGQASNPREAALQGLEKMRRLIRLGLKQGFLPPHPRPFWPTLEAAGFGTDPKDALPAAAKAAPGVLGAAWSASPMWTANAATVAPSCDTSDGRVHFTPANLSTMLHRSQEGGQTQRALSRIFAAPERFAVHAPLPMHAAFSDEGAANHTRLCAEYGAPGVHVFVYGRDAGEVFDGRFPARQTKLSCEAIARRHGLDPKRVVLIRQSKEAIDAGAFHNDVVCVGSLNTLFFHEKAFEGGPGPAMEAIRRAADGLFEPEFVIVREAEVPLADAISSYLFNSQLLQPAPGERLMLLGPGEVDETDTTRAFTKGLATANGPIGAVMTMDLRQSMKNGGGPACLRLRVELTADEAQAVHPGFLLTEERITGLSDFVRASYRDRVTLDDLRDPAFAREAYETLDRLTQIAHLGSDFYAFQTAGA